MRLIRRNPAGRYLTKHKVTRFNFPGRDSFATTAEYVAIFCQLNNLIP